MASIDRIMSAYRGRKAEVYDEVRNKQRRWHHEHRIVGEMLEASLAGKGRHLVLDLPVGTGRFIWHYRRLRIGGWGIDSSEAMLARARTKNKGTILQLTIGDARKTDAKPGHFEIGVCVRFLNLIEAEMLGAVLREFSRTCRNHLILTIRLGEEYHSNSEMATHDEKKFRRLMSGLGWRCIRDETEMFQKGWHLMHWERKR